GHGDGLQRDTEPAAGDVTVLGEQRDDARDGRGWNHDDPAARSEGRHAQAGARGVEYRPALLATSQGEIEHDASVDQAASARMPFGSGEIDESEPRTRAADPVGADRQRQRADLGLSRAAG